LGHVVNSEGIHLDPEKVRGNADFPTPQNPKELQSFLGLSSYFRRFVKNFAQRAHVLHQLLRKDVNWNCNAEAQNAFDYLKHALCNPPVLAYYNPAAALELEMGKTILLNE